MIQVRQRRSPKEIYQAWVDAEPGDQVYKSADAAVAARHAYVKAFVPELMDMSVIDIGGGDGKFAKSLPLCENWALMAEDMPELPTFDAATILWTLENCGSANAVIENTKRILRKNGTLVVATGSRILVPYKKPLWAYVAPGEQDLHPWRFSANTLQRILMEHGFEIARINDYLSSDYLVVVAKNPEKSIDSEKKKDFVDNYRAVTQFFDLWHQHTQGWFPPCGSNETQLDQKKQKPS